jgi:ATP-dependent Zn protease
MEPQERTAYHEAGHAAVANQIKTACVANTRIVEVAGVWSGETNISAGLFAELTPVQKTAIAIAGLLAEARAVAVAGEETRRIHQGAVLTEELGRVLGIAAEGRSVQ